MIEGGGVGWLVVCVSWLCVCERLGVLALVGGLVGLAACGGAAPAPQNPAGGLLRCGAVPGPLFFCICAYIVGVFL